MANKRGCGWFTIIGVILIFISGAVCVINVVSGQASMFGAIAGLIFGGGILLFAFAGILWVIHYFMRNK